VRARRVIEGGAGSTQDYDAADAAAKVAVATIGVSEATIAAGRANVKRLEDLQRFQRVTAPFAGVVTARNYDSGALMLADNAATKELFHIAQLDTIRVFADVPQTFATGIRVGQTAPVFRREVPGREFPGTVTRTANALDPATRTLRVEVDVPNPDKALLPGMYLQIRFNLEAPAAVVQVPGAAVITRADGAKVAVVDGAGAVRYRAVTVGRDLGTTVELTTGLAGGETLVVRPGDDLPDGTPVEAVTPAAR
jgi:RND family efflux transporter MFP subunit